ncbi:MAG: 50S ribosomal protein L3 [Peptococcaceae bacterium]|nr:50S ribosomal protein L3 [Peptococcaceae bacterium]
MTQIFTEEGTLIPVTVVEAGPCYVLQKKTVAKDGYNAIQVGFADKKERLVNKPDMGQFQKAGVGALRYIREFRTDRVDIYEVGQTIDAGIFNVGDRVDVSGISRGKGFVGMHKRHGGRRGPMSHGSKYHHRTGSMGAKGPGRVFKGRNLPGRMGTQRVTVQNLEVVQVDPEKNLILIKGCVPGAKKSMLILKSSVKVGKLS